MYNNGQVRSGINHTLYSPVWKKAVKGATVAIHPLDKKLGIDCVYDWKVSSSY